MFNKTIDQIAIDDITQLIENKIGEGKEIDFKKEYNLNTDNEKGEFLADISSFANTVGGWLIFGVLENEGIAKEILSFSIDNIDKEILKIENIIREGISPRISTNIKFIPEDIGKYLLVIKINKSWISPHRVIYTGYNKTKDQFYGRNSGGKYQLDVTELRTAFNLSETIKDKITNFKTQRIHEIYSDNTPIPLQEGLKIVLHIIPLESFSNLNLSIKELYSIKDVNPLFSSSWNNNINIDGRLLYNNHKSYTQIYRNGIIEIVGTGFFSKEKIIATQFLEKSLINHLDIYLQNIKKAGISLPIYIFLTLVGATGYKIGADRSGDGEYIDRNIISLPEHELNDYNEEISKILHPMFNIIRNACGFDSSANFTENGEFITH